MVSAWAELHLASDFNGGIHRPAAAGDQEQAAQVIDDLAATGAIAAGVQAEWTRSRPALDCVDESLDEVNTAGGGGSSISWAIWW
jgi:hypothetical protein